MKNPPPVDVDIILDPFLVNLLPRSLVPTVIYIIATAVLGYLLSRAVLSMFDWGVFSTANDKTSGTSGEKKTN